MTAVVGEIIDILVSGLTEYATGFGAAIGAAVEGIFLSTGEAGAVALSTTGGVIVVFAAVSLAIGITRVVFNWVMSLGANH